MPTRQFMLTCPVRSLAQLVLLLLISLSFDAFYGFKKHFTAESSSADGSESTAHRPVIHCTPKAEMLHEPLGACFRPLGVDGNISFLNAGTDSNLQCSANAEAHEPLCAEAAASRDWAALHLSKVCAAA